MTITFFPEDKTKQLSPSSLPPKTNYASQIQIPIQTSETVKPKRNGRISKRNRSSGNRQRKQMSRYRRKATHGSKRKSFRGRFLKKELFTIPNLPPLPTIEFTFQHLLDVIQQDEEKEIRDHFVYQTLLFNELVGDIENYLKKGLQVILHGQLEHYAGPVGSCTLTLTIDTNNYLHVKGALKKKNENEMMFEPKTFEESEINNTLNKIVGNRGTDFYTYPLNAYGDRGYTEKVQLPFKLFPNNWIENLDKVFMEVKYYDPPLVSSRI